MFKKLLVVLPSLLAVLAASGASDAMPTTSRPAPGPVGTRLPSPALDPLPSISDFAFLGGGTTKTNANVDFATEIGIRDSGSLARTGTLIVKRNNSTVLKSPFTIASGQTKTVPLADGIGAKKTCSAADYDLQLVGNGFDVTKKARVTPSCTFTSTATNPWNLASPDLVEARKKNRVSFDAVESSFAKPAATSSSTIPPSQAAACGSVLSLKTTVHNGLGHAVSGMRLEVKLNGVVVGTSAPFGLAAGQYVTESVTTTFDGEAGAYAVSLADPANSTGGALADSGYHVDVAHVCSLSAGLVP